MKELIYLMSGEQASSLYVSFNNESSMSMQSYFKDPLQEFCDRIGFAARKGELRKLDWSNFRDTYHIDSMSLTDWLGKEDCILFVDELNLLTSISSEVTKILKSCFLIPKGRGFCFSSHLATTSSTLREFLPDPSSREMIPCQLPLVSSLSEARTKLGYQKQNAREALYFGLIPGLLVERERAQDRTISSRRAYAVETFIAQMNLMGEAKANASFRLLLGSFITGSVSVVPEILQELMTAERKTNDMLLRWIPCHMEYLLREMWAHCKFLRNKSCVKSIYENFGTYLGAKEQTGDAFEALFIVVAIIRCLSGNFESDILPLKNKEEDLIVECDSPFVVDNFDTEDPYVFVAGIPETLQDQESDQVSIYYPGHARFNAYDAIVAVWTHGDGKRKLYGYQLKEGQAAGKPFAYDTVFDASYLIRGKSTSQAKSIGLLAAGSENQVDTFFGISGSQWTPRAWKALQESKTPSR